MNSMHTLASMHTATSFAPEIHTQARETHALFADLPLPNSMEKNAKANNQMHKI